MKFDTLDLVKLVMELEKIFNFSFSDELFEYVFSNNNKPFDFVRLSREIKLDQLGID